MNYAATIVHCWHVALRLDFRLKLITETKKYKLILQNQIHLDKIGFKKNSIYFMDALYILLVHLYTFTKCYPRQNSEQIKLFIKQKNKISFPEEKAHNFLTHVDNYVCIGYIYIVCHIYTLHY